MDKLKLPHAKLFYFSSELFKADKINENEKLKLKEMVINDEPNIFEILEKYQKSGSLIQLENNLLALLRPHEKHLYQIEEVPEKQQIQEPEIPKQQEQQQIIPQQTQVQNNELNRLNGSPMQQPKKASDINYADNQYLAENQKQADWISQNPNVPDEISSPLGLQLLKRKKRLKKTVNSGKEHFKPFKVDI